MQEEGEESEGSESEPESPGIDPLVFSREEFDTGEVHMLSMCLLSICSSSGAYGLLVVVSAQL